MQNYLIKLQSTKVKQYWDQIQTLLKEGTIELKTWSMEPREGSFYARGAADRVMIDGKGIKGIRMIGFPEFEKVAKYYNDYIDEVAGIKQKMRDECGYNTSYILTLIHHALDLGDPAPTKSVSKVDNQAEYERVRHYRSRRG